MTSFPKLTYEALTVGEEFVSDPHLVTPEDIEAYAFAVDDHHPWFAGPSPLRSGWAFGEGYLDGGVQVVEAAVGKGRLCMFAPEITFRAQPHGTFKLLFNGIYLASATARPESPMSTPR